MVVAQRCLVLATVFALGVLFHSPSAFAIVPSSINNPQLGQVRIDHDGRLHAVWTTQTGKKSGLFYQIFNPFSLSLNEPAIRITETLSRLRRPQLMFDGRGEVHVLWQERFAKAAGARTAQGTWVHYARFHPEGIYHGRSFQHVVLNSRPKAFHPDLTVDLDGNALVIWEEGQESLILTKIGSDGSLYKPFAVSSAIGIAKRAFPAVTTDRSGNVHLSWTGISNGQTDRIVYAVLEKDNLRPVVSERTIHSVPSARGQRKSLSVGPSGRIRLAWSAKNGHGRLAGFASKKNYLLIAPVVSPLTAESSFIPSPGIVSRVVDRHLQKVPKITAQVLGQGTLSRQPVLIEPDRGRIEKFSLTLSVSGPDYFSVGIEKALKRRVLEFSSWSGAPPRARVIVSAHDLLRIPRFPFLALPHQIVLDIPGPSEPNSAKRHNRQFHS